MMCSPLCFSIGMSKIALIVQRGLPKDEMHLLRLPGWLIHPILSTTTTTFFF